MRNPAQHFSDRRPALDWRGPPGERHPHSAPSREPFSEKAATPVADYATILGESRGLHRVLDQIEVVAPTDATVLVLGETGVGKELVARSIHQHSLRHHHPMVTVNCTAVPRDLFESEFFGHVRGAFSGALRDRTGRLLLADGGTLFLDEVGDLPLDLQPKLLRALQEAEFEAVGDDTTHRVDVRIIAASNRDLGSAVRSGRFREDLYYRLSVFPIEVPPLRDRRDDIAVLAGAFLEAACKRFHRTCPVLTQSHLAQLRDYAWPGNVRELQNVVERAVIKAHLGILQFEVPSHSPYHLSKNSKVDSELDAASFPEAEDEVVRDDEMKRRERRNLIAALQRSHGKIFGKDGAAELLGIKPTTLNARIKKLGLKYLEEAPPLRLRKSPPPA